MYVLGSVSMALASSSHPSPSPATTTPTSSNTESVAAAAKSSWARPQLLPTNACAVVAGQMSRATPPSPSTPPPLCAAAFSATEAEWYAAVKMSRLLLTAPCAPEIPADDERPAAGDRQMTGVGNMDEAADGVIIADERAGEVTLLTLAHPESSCREGETVAAVCVPEVTHSFFSVALLCWL